MTIDKFGRYLQDHKGKSSSPLTIRKNQVDFENRILRNVKRGFLKNDVVIKEQLDEVMNRCLLKIKEVSHKHSTEHTALPPPPPPPADISKPKLPKQNISPKSKLPKQDIASKQQ